MGPGVCHPAPARAEKGRLMRRLLEGLYTVSDWTAMAALAAIAVLVMAQVLGRVIDAILVAFGQAPFGFLVPSLAEIAGFLLVAASFLALSGTMRAGAHIRVTLGIASLPPHVRRPAEIVVLGVAAALAIFFFCYAVLLVRDSYRFGEVSYGIIPVPLWIPQAAMA